MGPLLCNNSEILFESVFDGVFDAMLERDYSSAKKVVITDENVYELWGQKFITGITALKNAELIVVPAGEESKSIEICNEVWQALSDYQIGRQDLVINLGGGVITDLGGFIASTYKRGIPFVNVPTTLLSMADASVGGKTGIDLGPHKNQIGVFAVAEKVYLDTSFLSTLDENQLLSGFAEMLKHGLALDANHWNSLKAIKPASIGKDAQALRSSVELKAKVVSSDFKEADERKKLNFGHTIAHAFEGYFLQKGMPVLHGYAVAIGMIAEAELSRMRLLIDDASFQEIKSVILSNYSFDQFKNYESDALIKLMQNDKKNDGTGINFTLIDGIGSCRINQEVSIAEIQEALSIIQHL